MTQHVLRVITNLPGLDAIRTDRYRFEAHQISEDESFRGGLLLFLRPFATTLCC